VNPDEKPSYNLINRLFNSSRQRNLSEDKIERLRKWRDNYVEKKRKRDSSASDTKREEEQEEPLKKKALLSFKNRLISNKSQEEVLT
jgi:hypothetical protein